MREVASAYMTHGARVADLVNAAGGRHDGDAGTSLWLVTARPTSAGPPGRVCDDPTCVQVVPWADALPVTVPPARTRFSRGRR